MRKKFDSDFEEFFYSLNCVLLKKYQAEVIFIKNKNFRLFEKFH